MLGGNELYTNTNANFASRSTSFSSGSGGRDDMHSKMDRIIKEMMTLKRIVMRLTKSMINEDEMDCDISYQYSDLTECFTFIHSIDFKLKFDHFLNKHSELNAIR